ncbi:MAG: NAD-dependent epimerase/dehydratase family protein [Pseudomonadales bacterium]
MPDARPTPAGDPKGSILLTGATGFIGRRLLDRLLADGWRVRVLARSTSAHFGTLNSGAEVVHGSLTDAAALGRGVAGTFAVINCAGTVRGSRFEDFEPANVTGVRALCEAITRQRTPPALLHLSSLAAEAPELSHYARSKQEGERVLHACDALRWTVLRPPAVYGPGDTEMRPALSWARRGLVPVPGGDPKQRLSMLHVDDLVEAVCAWLKSPASHLQQTYALDDGKADGYDWHELAAAVSSARSRKPIFVPLPAGLLNAVAWLNESLSRLTGRAVMLSRGKVRELTRARWVADGTAFRRASGWAPRIGLAQGVSGLFES